MEMNMKPSNTDHMRKILFFLLACSFTGLKASSPRLDSPIDSVYLFAYTTAAPTDGVHFAYSTDRHNWTVVGNRHTFFQSDFGTWGAQKKLFTPSFAVKPDGEWFAAFALGKGIHQFATTRSANLWVWKPQDYPYINKGDDFTNPILTYADGVFVLRYQTQSGCCLTRSSDFRSWSAPVAISQQEYDVQRKRTSIVLNGELQEGEIHRLPYSTLTNLLLRVNDAEVRNRNYNENCGEDGQRFRNVKAVNASLRIHPDETKAISTDLIGIFFEDINYSADGGLYAELIQNRDFEYNHLDRGEWDGKSFWELKGEGTSFEIAEEQPIHANNSHYAVLTTTEAGASLQNNGFDGIVLRKGEKYDLSLFVRSLDGTDHKLMVRILDGDKELDKVTLKVPPYYEAGTNGWKHMCYTVRPSVSTTHATLSIEPLEAGKIGVDFVSLFPLNTFKKRENGLRADLAQALADLKPRFVRFPGGCVSHGNGLENMYRWRTTIGPLWERKAQSNIWGYHQSKGLGFFEYFQFCEDIGAEPLPVLPAGVPCQNSSRGGHGQQGGLPMDEMDEYAQELLDLIEWANGDAKTSQLARMRADAGHPAPFNLKYLGIGNEDLISDVFTERFNYLNRIVKQRYPNIQVVGTVGPFFEGSDYEYGWQLAREEHVDIVDEHYYVNPGWYLHNQNFYDTYSREGTKVYLGEWASRGNRLENALAEALHITNLERNADVVVMSSYAPLLAKHGHTQWNPDLIYFNNTEVFPTVNYQVQRLCGNNAGSQYVYSDFDVKVQREERGKDVQAYDAAVSRRLSRSVVKDETTGDLIVKFVNIMPVAADVRLDFGSTDAYNTMATVSTLSGQPADKDNVPVTSQLSIASQTTCTLPPYSFTVIRLTNKSKKKS